MIFDIKHFVPFFFSPDILMKSIKRLRTGCWPTQSSVLKWPSSVAQDWAVWPICWRTRPSSLIRTSHVSPPALVGCIWTKTNDPCLDTVQNYVWTACVLCSARSCRSAGVREAAGPWVCLYAGAIPLLRGLRHTNGKLQYVKYTVYINIYKWLKTVAS